jgi:hypothetical protein
LETKRSDIGSTAAAGAAAVDAWPEPLSVVDDVDESASTLTRVETPTDEPAIPAVSDRL